MQQGMSQSMVATAAMQMFMRALQATGMELSQMAAAAVAANPALEELPEPGKDRREAEGDAGDFYGDGSGGVDYEATRRHDVMMDSLTEEISLKSRFSGKSLDNPREDLYNAFVKAIDYGP